MKKILFYILLVSSLSIISCSDSSGDSDETEYIISDFSAVTQYNKEFTLGSVSCSSGTACQAIIFHGKVSDINYVGIAVKNTSPSYSLKIYWHAKSVPVGTGLTLSGCTIKENGTTLEDVDVTADIANNGNNTYTITFPSGISGTSIVSTNKITARYYD